MTPGPGPADSGQEPASLEAWLEDQHTRPAWPVVRGMIAAMLDALEDVHATGRALGAISPRTLVIDRLDRPVPRVVVGLGTTPVPGDDTEGAAYVAPECRGGFGASSPASDMFALAAVAYRMVVGRPPEMVPAGQQRPIFWTAGHLAADDYPADFLAAIDTTLEAVPAERPGIGDWRARALPAPVEQPAALPGRSSDGRTAPVRSVDRDVPSRMGRGGDRGVSRLLWAAALGLAVTGLLGAWLLVRLSGVLVPIRPPVSAPPAPVASETAARGPGGAETSPVSAPPVDATAATTGTLPARAPETDARLTGITPAPPSSFRDCDNCPEMVVIHPGTARMRLIAPGTSEPRELVVSIPRAFAVGRFELTRGEFRAFAEATGFTPAPGCRVRRPDWKLDTRLSWRDPGYPQDDRHPVACLNLDDARHYVAWLSRQTGKSYRLLTDAEWHLIASTPDIPSTPGEGQCRFANGADLTARDAEPGWETANCRDGYLYTAPVGSFAATGSGVADMFGNLWEWVDSCMPDLSGATPSVGVCAQDAPRILRGGSWSDGPGMIALDTRVLSPPLVRDQIAGVRIGRDLSPCEAGEGGCAPLSQDTGLTIGNPNP